jgi:hypothetical protein
MFTIVNRHRRYVHHAITTLKKRRNEEQGDEDVVTNADHTRVL